MSEEKHGYWRHKKIPSDKYVKGYYYTRECQCSVCGKESSIENQRCTYCGAIMDLPEPKK